MEFTRNSWCIVIFSMASETSAILQARRKFEADIAIPLVGLLQGVTVHLFSAGSISPVRN